LSVWLGGFQGAEYHQAIEPNIRQIKLPDPNMPNEIPASLEAPNTDRLLAAE